MKGDRDLFGEMMRIGLQGLIGSRTRRTYRCQQPRTELEAGGTATSRAGYYPCRGSAPAGATDARRGVLSLDS